MYLALTEDQVKEIRKLGIQLIEWKNCMRKGVDLLSHIFSKAIEKFVETWNWIQEKLQEFNEKLTFAIKEIKDRFHLPVSPRYRFVKSLGNMGYNKQRVWTLTRHRRLARSNC